MVGSGQSMALWQHMPGLTRLSMFLAEWDGGAGPFLVVLCSSSYRPGEVGNLGESSDHCQARSSSVLRQRGPAGHGLPAGKAEV